MEDANHLKEIEKYLYTKKMEVAHAFQSAGGV
jgi:hypothetical protein